MTDAQKLARYKRKIRKRNTVIALFFMALILLVLAIVLATCGRGGNGPEETSDTTVPDSTSDSSTAVDTTEPPDTGGNKLSLDEQIIIKLQNFSVDFKCRTVFVYDVEAGQMLFEKGGTKQSIAPASMTKLWTALYALEVLPENKVITPDEKVQEMLKPGSSTAYVRKNHMLTVSMLIEGMLIPSGNDCAYVLAIEIGRELARDPELAAEEAVKYFVIGLNEYCQKIGCKGTLFTCPDGMDDISVHYTTAGDLVTVSKLALENPILAEYMQIQHAKVKYASGHINEWENTNLLLNPDSEYYCKNCVGLKTGSNNDSYSLISAIKPEGGEKASFIIGTIDGEQKNYRFDDAKLIIDIIEGIR